MLRLGANRPQMVIGGDQSADVTFSDVSRPTITTNWTVHFDRHGQVTSAARSPVHQADVIALKP
jgi:PKD repeat protein